MSIFEIVLLAATLLVMLVGLVGTLLPVIPGVPVIFAAVLIHSLVTDFAYVSSSGLVLFGLLTAGAILMDWLATSMSVRKMGGSRAGVAGAILGMIVGGVVGFGLPGMLVGAFAGAMTGEILFGDKSRSALRAGLGGLIGFLAGGVAKFAIGAAMIGIFVYQVLF